MSLHQLALAWQPHRTATASLRQARWAGQQGEVVVVGQLDCRLTGAAGQQQQQQLDLMLTGARATYSPALASLATSAHQQLRPLLLQLSPAKQNATPAPSLALVATGSRLVWTGPSPVSLVFDLRELEAAGSPGGWRVTAGGARICRAVGNEETLVAALPALSLTRQAAELRAVLEEKVRLIWCPATHLLLLDSTSQLSALASIIATPAPPRFAAPAPPTLHLSLAARLFVQVEVGQHTARLQVSSLTAKHAAGGVSWLQAPRASLQLDGQSVLGMEELVLSAVQRSDKLAAERRRMQGVTVEHNRCLVVALASIAFTQPYQFNFHEVVMSELMTTFKWVKSLHKQEGIESYILPRDILINIKNVKLELTDDPFEVKLRDNYELKEYEYLESLKRMKVLEQRIEDMRKKNLMFPREKIEELLCNLQRKNAEIYVSRARKLFVESRTRLLECNVTGLEVMVVADPGMQGRDNVLGMMYSCDQFSPWPDPGQMQFSTLWCRWLRLEASSITFCLRDFPQKLLDIGQLLLWGKLAGAEVAPGKRATRTAQVRVGQPYPDQELQRNLNPLKFYYDLACDVDTLSLAYGSCWEPAVTQCSLALAYMTGVSMDPSPALPWWDKTRLLLHGRLLLAVRSTQLLLHASLDPYNTTEEMAICFTGMDLEWEEGVVRVRGTLDVNVRTASKYDDGHILHLPGVLLTVKMEWASLANPLDHHAVTPCAPDKVPEYSSNQEHDSYRAFRSKHLNISASIETRPCRAARQDRPKMDMFSSTLRWFESLKVIFSGASRPIRRGQVFRNSRPRKPQFSRHFKRVGLSVSLHQFQVNYWTSFSQQRGVLLNVARGINLSTEHTLTLLPYKDGLKRRSRADWSVSFINSELATSDIWIQTALEPESPAQSPEPGEPGEDGVRAGIGEEEATRNMERSFFFSVEKVVYMRMGRSLKEEAERPTHKLVIHGARGAWTQSNRDMWFALYDSWRRAQILRTNVSSDALKSFHAENCAAASQQPPGTEEATPAGTPYASPPGSGNTTTSPYSSFGLAGTGAGGRVGGLFKLLEEADSGITPTACCEEMSEAEEEKASLEAMVACTMDDILHRNWSIELVNSQVLLKGIETKGYVIISAARATVSQNVCRPVWKEKTLLSKTTWSGALETMQYYATVSDTEGADLDSIQWLTMDNIGEGAEQRLPGPAGLVGSGKAVGGVVSKVVGVTDSPGELGIQLQRIVSRCKAEFFYVSYGDTELESVEKQPVPAGPDGWAEQETAVNAFSFVHHDLNASTNSLQYAMLLDIANNLLLYTEPGMKERTDRYLRMRYLFMLEIGNIEEQRKRIIRGQNQLRQVSATPTSIVPLNFTTPCNNAVFWSL